MEMPHNDLRSMQGFGRMIDLRADSSARANKDTRGHPRTAQGSAEDDYLGKEQQHVSFDLSLCRPAMLLNDLLKRKKDLQWDSTQNKVEKIVQENFQSREYATTLKLQAGLACKFLRVIFVPTGETF